MNFGVVALLPVVRCRHPLAFRLRTARVLTRQNSKWKGGKLPDEALYAFNVLKEHIATYATLGAEKLRAQQSYCSEVSVFVCTNMLFALLRDKPSSGLPHHVLLQFRDIRQTRAAPTTEMGFATTTTLRFVTTLENTIHCICPQKAKAKSKRMQKNFAGPLQLLSCGSSD